MAFKEIVVPASPCPYCGVVMDAATHTDGDKAPEAGDLCFCIACGNWQQFDQDLRRIPASQEQLDYAAKDERTRAIKLAWFLDTVKERILPA
jgi:hypothetical protein